MKKFAKIAFLMALVFFLCSQGFVHSVIVETWCQEGSESGTCGGNDCCLSSGGSTCVCWLDTGTWEHSCGSFGDVVQCDQQ